MGLVQTKAGLPFVRRFLRFASGSSRNDTVAQAVHRSASRVRSNPSPSHRLTLPRAEESETIFAEVVAELGSHIVFTGAQVIHVCLCPRKEGF